MKKVICGILALMMALSVTGCKVNRRTVSDVSTNASGSAKIVPEKNAKIKIWASKSLKDWISAVGEKFKSEYKSYNVDFSFTDVADFLVADKIDKDGPAGVGPDVFLAPHDKLGDFVGQGLVRENNVTADDMKKNDEKAAVNAAGINGKIYGYPLSVTTYVLAYNKALVTKVPETFDDIKAFAKTFNTGDRYAFLMPLTEPFYDFAFLQGYGGYIFKNGTNSNDIGLNNSGAVEGMKFLKSIKEYAKVKYNECQLSTVQDRFNTGKCAMMFSQIWAIKAAESQGVKVGLTTLPKMSNGKRPAPLATIQELFVSSYAKYPKAAKLFAKIATSDEMLLKLAKSQSIITASKKVNSNSAIKNDPTLSVFAASVRDAVPTPLISAMSSVWQPYEVAVQSIWDNDKDVKESMDTCVKTIKDQLKINSSKK